MSQLVRQSLMSSREECFDDRKPTYEECVKELHLDRHAVSMKPDVIDGPCTVVV